MLAGFYVASFHLNELIAPHKPYDTAYRNSNENRLPVSVEKENHRMKISNCNNSQNITQ